MLTLKPDELRELTGTRIGERQRAWLKERGIPFRQLPHHSRIFSDTAPALGRLMERRMGGGPLRLKVNNPRNSVCAMPLGSLDWTRWFTDGAVGSRSLYLHVYGPDDTIQRVYCRRSAAPRLAFKDGCLWWLID